MTVCYSEIDLKNVVSRPIFRQGCWPSRLNVFSFNRFLDGMQLHWGS